MTLAEDLVRLCLCPMAPAARSRARRHLLDWIGCVLGAGREPLADALEKSLGGAMGAVPSFGLGPLTFDAALTHATALGNLLEMDDLARSALLHPGPVIAPTAVYTGIRERKNYGDLLDAMVRGYEAAIRLGGSLDPFHYQRWHPTTTVGIGAGAVTASRLIGLDADRTVSALGNALSVSGGLWHMRHHDVGTKQWHCVHAVRTGMAAADTAKLGFSGSREIVEGPQGWHAVMAAEPSPAAITRDADWLIGTTSFKPWPACRHCHPAIDAALMAKREVAPADIAALHVDTYHDAIVFCDNARPKTAGEARFSLQHCVAVAVAKECITPADFQPDALEDAPLPALRRMVTVAEDAAFTEAYPAHFGARLTVTLADGSTRDFNVHDAMGDPEWPMTDATLLDKYDMLAQWGLGANDRARALAETVLHAPEETPITNLLEAAP